MTALLIALTTLATSYVLMMRRTLIVQRARWEVYAARDELRWYACRDRAFASSELFKWLDHEMTGLASIAPVLTAWTLLAVVLSGTGANPRVERLRAQLALPENRLAAALHQRSMGACLTLLRERHLVLTAVIRLAASFRRILLGKAQASIESLADSSVSHSLRFTTA